MRASTLVVALLLATCADASLLTPPGAASPTWQSNSGRRRCAPPVCAAPEFIFDLPAGRDTIKFGCRQRSVTMVKPEAAGSLQDFIGSSSDVIVMSSWDEGKVRRIEGTEDEYLISVEEFDFVALRFAVELHVRCTLDKTTTTAKLESLGFRMIGTGLDNIADAINVRVTGALRPSAPDSRICALSGDVSFVASGALPPVLRAAPEPALRAAANLMSQSLIGAAQDRFGKRVPKAYEKWARLRGGALCATQSTLPRVPRSPSEMVRAAAASVSRAAAAGVLRQQVNVVVPEDERTYKVFNVVEIQGTSAPEDLDPWPGGLLQQYPIALALGRQILAGVTGSREADVSDQVLDAEDACGLILSQGETPTDDAACVLFCGTDQMDDLARVDAMASGRLLCLLNPQFKREQDFSLWQRGKAKAAFFDKGYETAYAFEEFGCRGEDVKLVGEWGVGWRAFVYLDDNDAEGMPLHDGCLDQRPSYNWLEAQINARHPSPRWARALDKVDTQGLRFMRGDADQ